MTAKDQMSHHLNQLTRENEDTEDQKDKEIHFTDPSICRPFLLGICLNDLFINTRKEMGDCAKTHSIEMKEEFEKATVRRDYGFEEEVQDYLQGFMKSHERKIEEAKNLVASFRDSPELEALVQEVDDLEVQIGEKMKKIEELGQEGNVDESLAVLKEVKDIKQQKKQLEERYYTAKGLPIQQKLTVCEVCGAFMNVKDYDSRVPAHFGGKVHMGYVTIREKIVVLEEIIAKKREKRKKVKD